MCKDKVDVAINRLKTASEMSLEYYQKPLMIAYSGGKDSDCILQLALMAGIPIEIVNSHTTADAPETVKYIRRKFYDLELKGYTVKIEKPLYKGKRTSMWDLIPKKKMPPTRTVRYCCSILKETSGQNRHIVTGVRWQESTKRKTRGIYETVNRNKDKRIILNNDNDDKRKLFEACKMQGKTVTNPIIDWSDAEVIDFNKEYVKTCNPLYCMGFQRVGCIGCPMAGKKRYTEFRIFPKYKQMYIKAFDRLVDVLRQRNLPNWQNGIEVYKWWMGENPEQMNFFETGD